MNLKSIALASPNFVKMFEDNTSRYYEGEILNGKK
jgi:hypothetical protein